MSKYLLDTGIFSDFINRRHGVDQRVREARRQGSRLGTCIPVIGELYYGAELSSHPELNRQRIGHALREVAIWP